MTQKEKDDLADIVAEFIRGSDELSYVFNAEMIPTGGVNGWATFVQGDKTLTLTAVIKKVI